MVWYLDTKSSVRPHKAQGGTLTVSRQQGGMKESLQSVSDWQAGDEDEDIFEFGTDTPWQMVRLKFAFLLSASFFYNDYIALAPFQELRKTNPSAYWTGADDQPYVILYISHTWETPGHPDPTGRQAHAIRRLLRQVYTVYLSQEACADNSQLTLHRCRYVPDLLVEGVTQAAAILVCWQQGRQRAGHAPKHLSPEDFMSHIAIFYDYSCLPQNFDPKRHSPEEDLILRDGLQHMEGLCRISIVIALRFRNDAFLSRAWCATEYTTGTSSFGDSISHDQCTSMNTHMALPLQVDRWGQGFLEPDSQSPVENGKTRPLQNQIVKEIQKIRNHLDNLNHEWKNDGLSGKLAKYIWGHSKDSILEKCAVAASRLVAKMQESHNLDSMNSMLTIKESLSKHTLQVLDHPIQSIPLPEETHPLSMSALVDFFGAWVFTNWMSRTEIEGPLQFDVGYTVAVLLYLGGLSCTVPSDLTYLGLTAAAANTNHFLSPFFRACWRVWLDQPLEQQDDFVIKLYPLSRQNGWTDDQREWLTLCDDYAAFQRFYAETRLSVPLDEKIQVQRELFLQNLASKLYFEIVPTQKQQESTAVTQHRPKKSGQDCRKCACM